MTEYKIVYPGSDDWKNCKTPQACHLTIGSERSKSFCMTCSIVGFGLSDTKIPQPSPDIPDDNSSSK